MSDEQNTLRDHLESAFETHQTEQEPAPASSSEPSGAEEPAGEAAARVRDGQGRFAKAEKPEEAGNAGIQTPEKTDPAADPLLEKPRVGRPSSWKKDYEADWETLPDRLREYIAEREGQFAKGVSTYKAQWDQVAPVWDSIQPFMPELQQHGLNPAQWIQNLGNAHRTLALGSPEQKAQMFSQLATDYGIDLGALTGQPVNPQFSHLASELNQMRSQFQSWQQAQAQQEQQQVNDQIQAFSQGKEFFEQVRPTMAQLLQSGVASDLQDAYDKAIRLNDEIWKTQQASQAKAAEADRQRVIAEKKAKAVSPKSAAPTASAGASGGKKGLREALESAFCQADSNI